MALVRSQVGEEFLTSVWDWCKVSIMKNISSFWLLAGILVYKANNGRTAEEIKCLLQVNFKLGRWSFTSLCEQVDMRPPAGWNVWPSKNFCTRNQVIYFIIIRIYTAKSRPSTPKRQRCLSTTIYSSMFLFLMKSVTWYFHDCSGLPIFLQPCGIHW